MSLVTRLAIAFFSCASSLCLADVANDAWRLLREGELDRALGAYSKLIIQSPNDPDNWLGRGLARSRLGQWKDSISDLEKAVELAPGYEDAWSALADVYWWNDQHAAAANAYGRLAALRPLDMQVRIRQARSLLASGDSEGAQNAIESARLLGAKDDELPLIRDRTERSKQNLSVTVDTPNLSLQGYKWAFSGGLYRTHAGSFSANETSLSLRHYTPLGSIAIERLGQARFGYSDEAWAIDAYPRLWRGAYANLRYQRTTSPDLYPTNAWRAELYQSIGSGWELAANRDYLGFGSGVRIDGVSIGKYWANFFIRLRHQKVESGNSSGGGDRLFVRYYYEGDGDHYLEANVSRGRSDDFSTGIILPSRSNSRGLVWYHFLDRSWGLKVSFSQSIDTAGIGLKARDGGLSIVRRW